MNTYSKHFYQIFKQISTAQYSENVVCFLDLLGYKERALKSSKPMDLSIILLLQQFKDAVSELCEEMHIYAFSDSIFIVAPKGKILDLLKFVSIFSVHILTDSEHQIIKGGKKEFDDYQLVRGGIVLGNSYADDNILLGSAPIHAYNMESSIAKYPRIIVGEKVCTLLQEKEKMIKEDDDKQYYLDYILTFDYFTKDFDSIKDTLLKCEKWAKDQAKKFQKQAMEQADLCKKEKYINIAQKYFWFNKYLSSYTQSVFDSKS